MMITKSMNRVDRFLVFTFTKHACDKTKRYYLKTNLHVS